MTSPPRTPAWTPAWAPLAALLTILWTVSSGVEARPVHGAGRDPVIVELFTAQGCATCPEANGMVADLAARKEVLPLTFSVDYWDYLGWQDTLAKPEFDTRQRAYVQRLKVREIYTPEVVVAGAEESAALDGRKIDGLIAKAAHARRPGPRLRLLHRDSRVRVEGAGGSADVWLIRYDPRAQVVKIKSGENRGRTVTVHNPVRELRKLGPWQGSARTYPLPKAAALGLKTVVLVQARRGGAILAAVRG